jgi:hypothetical protein
MKIVVVEWQDIITDMVWNGEPEPLDPPVFKTVGFLMEETEDKIVICDTDPGTGNRCAFPVGCIISIEEVRVDEKDFTIFNT